MNNKKLVNELKRMVDTHVTIDSFPIKNGNRINIGSYSIKPVNEGWSVLSYKTNDVIATTYTKAAALAIAKNISINKDIRKSVDALDKVVAKHHTDCKFYQHTLHTTNNFEKYQVVMNRFCISNAIQEDAREKIKSFIL